jgi:hypothetical protein
MVYCSVVQGWPGQCEGRGLWGGVVQLISSISSVSCLAPTSAAFILLDAFSYGHEALLGPVQLEM